MNPALTPPSAGTAPHDEIGSRLSPDNGQRDDREATMAPEERFAAALAEAAQAQAEFKQRDAEQERIIRDHPGLPDGFRWGKTAAGKPMIVPTRDNVLELHELVSDTFERREERYEEMPGDQQLAKGLNKVQTQLGKVNEFLGSGLAYQLARAYGPEFASAMNWVRIHATNVARYQDAGNETAAENSLINLESSRQQAFMAAQVLDWCVDAGAKVDLMKATQDALNLAGWRLMNQQASADRKTVQRTTRDLLWSRSPKTPDEELEATEEELNEAFG